MKNSDDVINWNGTTYYKLRGLSAWVSDLISNGGLLRYRESCARSSVCPLEYAKDIESSGVYAVDSYGADMTVFKRVNARAKLNEDYSEVTSKTLHMTNGIYSHMLLETPETKGKYLGNESFTKKSLGFEVTVSYLKETVRAYYKENPVVLSENDSDDFLDGVGDKVPHGHMEEAESNPVEVETEDIKVESGLSVVKRWAFNDREVRNRMPREVMSAIFSSDEIQNFYFNDRESQV